MAEDILLTIGIPTYNRKKKLIETLKLLEKEKNQRFYIVILDNNSNYNVSEEILKNNFKEDFLERIEVKKNSVNIGLEGNLLKILTISKTKWLWTLGDDDIPLDIAVDNIYKEIEGVSKIGVITFSACSDIEVIHKGLSLEDKEFNNLNDWVNYLYTRKISKKDIPNIYISLNVFNVEYIKEIMPKIVKYMYTAIGHVVYILYLQHEKGLGIKTTNKLLIKNGKYDEGESWANDFIPIMVQISTLSHLKLDKFLNKTEIKKLLELIIWIGPLRCYLECLKRKEKDYRRYYEILYDTNFKKSYSYKVRIISYICLKTYWLFEKIDILNKYVLPLYRKLKW